MIGFWMRLPRNRREALWWAIRMRFRWHYWRQTWLILPLWMWWVNRPERKNSAPGIQSDLFLGEASGEGNDPGSGAANSHPGSDT